MCVRLEKVLLRADNAQENKATYRKTWRVIIGDSTQLWFYQCRSYAL